MARSKSVLLSEATGKIGDVVIKRYPKGKIVISKVPDMSGVKLSKRQKTKNNEFKAAVKYAQGIISDPEKKEAYRKTIRRGKSVYHAAIQEYLRFKQEK